LYQDTIYDRFLHAATIRYDTEASSYLEKASAETSVMEIQNDLKMINSDIAIQERQLRILLNDTVELTFLPPILEERMISNIQESEQLVNNPLLAYVVKQIDIAQAEKVVQSSKLLPDLVVGYFNQSLIGSQTGSGDIAQASNRFSGIQAGVSIPLFFGSYKGNIQSAKLKAHMAQTSANYYSAVLKGQYEQQLQEVMKYRGSLVYYREKAVPQANLIISNAQKSFENGAINYVEYFQNLNQGLALKLNNLNALNGYNQAIINLEYLIGQ
jgi:cobalt-zinc-cadmium resistance protein CzcA